MSSTERLVSDYIDKLDAELAAIPRGGRREVLDEIETHIQQSLAELDPNDEVGVRNMLARLGEPVEIAAEARERFGVRSVQTTWREIGALILLPFAWLVGVVFLWVSEAWSTRDKLIGTLVLPGGFAVAFLFFLLAFVGPDSGPSPVWAIVRVALFGCLLFVPVVVDGYLIWRLRERAT